jgi:hypothetical protein
MHRPIRTFLLSLTASLGLAACEVDPTGPGQLPAPQATLAVQPGSGVWRSTSTWNSNLSGTYFQFSCDDGYESEMVRLEGVIRHRLTLMDDGAGGFHFQWHYDAGGARGVGEDSGDVFRVVYQQNETFNQSGAARTGTFRTTRRLISTGSGRGFRMVSAGKYIVDANGTLVIDRYETGFECDTAR